MAGVLKYTCTLPGGVFNPVTTKKLTTAFKISYMREWRDLVEVIGDDKAAQVLDSLVSLCPSSGFA